MYLSDPAELVGRSEAIAQLEDLVRQARAGRGTTTVVRGAAGIGKSALLGVAVRAADGMQVLRYRGVEAERRMPYAGLQLVLGGTPGRPPDLGGPLQPALETIFGKHEGRVDPALAGLAAAAVIEEAVRQRPTLIVLDDAHWLDDETCPSLAFAFRRLTGQPLCVVVATRTASSDPFADLPALLLSGLTTAEATAVFDAAILLPMDDVARRRIVAEAGGNPRLLLAAAAATTEATFAGGFGHPAATRGAWLDELGPDERMLLITAAADTTGDPGLLWRTIDELGIDRRAVTRLEDSGRLSVGSLVLFTDPDARTAVYHSADGAERRAAHRALAAATDSPTHRAWHLARAAIGPDDVLAAQLDQLSSHAHSPAAAAFLERSALLTQDTRLRTVRALRAAGAHLTAGSPTSTTQMLITAALGRQDHRTRAQLAYQQARLTSFTHPSVNASSELLHTAQAVDMAGAPSVQARLEALLAIAKAGRLGPGAETAVDKLPTRPIVRGLVGELLHGLTQRFAQGFAAGYPILRRALDRASHAEDIQWLWLAAHVAGDLWADDCWQTLSAAALDSAHRTGSLLVMPSALTQACVVLLHRGEFDQAARLLTRIDATTSAIQAPRSFTAALLHAAWRGTAEAAVELIRTARRAAQQRGQGGVLATASLAEAVLNNGLGRYSDALSAAQDAIQHDELLTYGRAAIELIEAASRTGEHAAGNRALAALTVRTQLVGTDWALGIEARSRALLTGDPEALYRQAIDYLSRTSMATDLARTRLVYGEWLRRQGRRVDARAELHLAHESLTSMGATAFAERADREYLAAGERARQAAGGGGGGGPAGAAAGGGETKGARGGRQPPRKGGE
ncbi:ATP-binding protein, partial [Kribbella sp. NPDC003557]|uniref:ATP-binding protein n=1 Tax=Kribbella sp. NPDC003557 TaxID=3154449 RepID=UPI0033AFB592